MGIIKGLLGRVKSEVSFKAAKAVTGAITNKISSTASNLTNKKTPENKCPKCNADCPAGTKFCNQCGSAL